MVILLKTASVRVSYIQIIQDRVQNKAKVFGKVYTTETYHGGTGNSSTKFLALRKEAQGETRGMRGMPSFQEKDGGDIRGIQT